MARRQLRCWSYRCVPRRIRLQLLHVTLPVEGGGEAYVVAQLPLHDIRVLEQLRFDVFLAVYG
jgi:hypothetical protein